MRAGLLCSVMLFPLASAAAQEGHANRPAPAKAPDKLTVEMAAAMKKLNRVKADPQVETTLTVIPLNWMDVKRGAKVLRTLFRDRPGFAVAALPEVRCLVVRADA